MTGTDGNDTITGTTASETLDGAGGDDLIINAGGGRDLFIGGAGQDTLRTDVTGIPPDFVVLFDIPNEFHGREGSEIGRDTIQGVESFELIGIWDSRLIGDDNVNVFTTDEGRDTLFGGGGDDVLSSGDGNDELRGNAGADTLDGGLGDDLVLGGQGDDVIVNLFGFDTADGGAGRDLFVIDPSLLEQQDFVGNINLSAGIVGTFEFGVSDIISNIEDVAIIGSDIPFQITGDALANSLTAFDGNDTVAGGAGADTLDGGAGNDTLFGNQGADYLIAGPGDDLLRGGAGNDTFTGAVGTDTLIGGTGSDTYLIDVRSFDADAFVVEVDLVLGDSGAVGIPTSRETLESIENITLLGPLSVTITGSVEANVLSTDTGADTVLGGIGADVISTGAGADIAGGGKGPDQIFGNQGADTLSGGLGPDSLLGQKGFDVLNGGDGFDLLDGGLGNDVLLGNQGADTLRGGDGNDALSGQKGFDVLNGGTGADTLTGGLGQDSFVFVGAWGQDVVTDFTPGEDAMVLDFADGLSAAAQQAAFEAALTQVGDNVRIDLVGDGVNTILLLGTALETVSFDDVSPI